MKNNPLEITHPDKLLFPSDNITKGDLADYYDSIAPHLLPFLKNHPLIIQRFPEGIQHEGFIQQHPFPKMPEWFSTCELKKKMGGMMQHILCQDKESLRFLINHGTIALHRWLSSYENPEMPDLLIIDLDPPKEGFKLACKAAKLFKQVFDEKKLTSFVMTTGSHGLHVVVHIQPKKDFNQTHNFVANIAKEIAEKYPKEFTLKISKKERTHHLYLDTLRNAYGHSAICPYSVRALPGAPVAAPIAWDELDDKELTAQKYTIKNIQQQIKKNPWKDFFKHAYQLPIIPK